MIPYLCPRKLSTHTEVLPLLLALATTPMLAQTTEKRLDMSVCVANEWTEPKAFAPVVIRLDELDELDFDVRSVTVNEGEVACQLDDMDGDGVVDELIFLADLPAGEERTFSISLANTVSTEEADAQPALVYADMMLADKKGKLPLITALETPGNSYVYSDLHHHGPAFESWLVAYRIYFDHRQNIDIYGKRHQQLELADTHFYTTTEQTAQGYGNDVLWAGSSVGCGSLKCWDGKAPADWKEVGKRMERIVSSGPLRTVVEVADIDALGGNTVSTYYILYGGHRDVEVAIHARLPLDEESLCTGVQKVNPQTARHLLDEQQGLAASWGSDYPEQSNQENMDRFPPEAVGLAVYVPEDSRQRAVDMEVNALFTLAGGNGLRYFISFCADKEEAEGSCHSADEWFTEVRKWKENLDHPISVNIQGMFY